jgi:hypothetical protein
VNFLPPGVLLLMPVVFSEMMLCEAFVKDFGGAEGFPNEFFWAAKIPRSPRISGILCHQDHGHSSGKAMRCTMAPCCCSPPATL